MKKIIMLLVIFSQLAFAYEYSNTLKQNIVSGCLKGGSSVQFCNCRLKAMQDNVSEAETHDFYRTMVSLFNHGVLPANVPNNQTQALREMAQCVGP